MQSEEEAEEAGVEVEEAVEGSEVEEVEETPEMVKKSTVTPEEGKGICPSR